MHSVFGTSLDGGMSKKIINGPNMRFSGDHAWDQACGSHLLHFGAFFCRNFVRLGHFR